LIALIITIIVIIILAAIVMNASADTVGNAQYARFAQEFGEFSDQVMLDSANVKSSTGIRGQIINAAQQYYMTANGFSNVESGDPEAAGDDAGLNKKQGVAGYAMPVGYVVTNHNTNANDDYRFTLQRILEIGKVPDDKANSATDKAGLSRISGDAQVAYIINDGVITNYSKYGDNSATTGEAAHEFYGDSNGLEFHYITSDGQVFTLPGYPVQQSDGSIEYHIDSKNGHYYVIKGNSGVAIGGTNVNGDVVVGEQPIQATYLRATRGINARTGGTLGAPTNGTGNPNTGMADYTVKYGAWTKHP
jgi:hypothetical protein